MNNIKVISAFIGVFMAGAVFGGLFTMGTASRQDVATVAVTPPVAVAPTTAVQGTPVATKAVTPKAPQARVDPKMMRQYTQRLNLTAEQREIIKPFMARAESELARLRRQNLQDTTREMTRMYENIARNLTPEQLAELEKMKAATLERLEEAKKAALPVKKT